MFFHITKPDVHVKEMKGLAEVLQPYTPPKHPQDDDISWLKLREVIIDGVPLIIQYSKADYGSLKSGILTIGTRFIPFIPFHVSCKLAKKFLDDKCLSLFEYVRETSIFHSWMVSWVKGVPVDSAQGSEEEYQGFKYKRILAPDK